MKESVKEHEAKIKHLEECISRISLSLEGMEPMTILADIDPNTIPEYLELQNQITHFNLELELLTGSQPKQDFETEERIHSLRQRIEEIAAEQGKLDLINANNTKIAQLESLIANTLQAKADLELEEDILIRMNRAVADEMERRCAEAFRHVKFRMLDIQLNGNEVATCYATYQGVRYADLNSAAQVNAGLDIINTLCRHYGIQVPIFIDNAEGINEIEKTESQMIQLVVSEDRPMKVTII